MFRTAQSPIQSRTLARDLIAALSARPAGAALVTPFVHLFTAGPTPITPDSVSADFTEATFAGYAASALTLPLVGPVNLPNNNAGGTNAVNWIAGSVVSPGQTILGYWIDDNATTPTKFYMAELFTDPVAIVRLDDFLTLDVLFAVQTYLGPLS